jgi:NAD(P) transhydrogenase subunit beta
MNNIVIQLVYLVTAFLLILGIKKMSSPKTARNGIIVAGWAVLIAILITFFMPQIHGASNYGLMIIAICIGGILAWYSGKKVKMIQIPQMIALYNGMGGGAAGAIGALELFRYHDTSIILRILAILGAMIGSLSFSGSIIAFAKLQDLIQRAIVLPAHRVISILIALAIIFFSVIIVIYPATTLYLIPFFILLLILGIIFTLPIGGANMPVVISLFNAMTGLAVGLNGFVLNNPALIIAGTVVGASGTLLTQLMAKAMNKTLVSIIFSPHPSYVKEESTAISDNVKPIDVNDAAIMLAYANRVIIAPGYGMAVAQAQHKIWELVQQLEQRGIHVTFAIHPVAGRMPGHMNVLLAEAGVPYDKILDLDEVNPEFANTDVVLVIGANDVVNPAARNEPNSPIYGMPILNVAAAHNVLVIKRGQGKGFSGVENSLFSLDNVRMLYGDGRDVVNKLVQAIKVL